MRSVAVRPSTPGMRMSISTTSGRVPAAAARLARRRRPRRPRSMSVAQPEHHASARRARAGRRRRCSDARVTRSTATMPRAGTRPRASVPCSSRPPASSARSRSPTSPAPAPGIAAVRRPSARGCAPRSEPVAGPAARPRRHGGVAGVLAGVGQRLPHDPVGVAPDSPGRRPAAGVEPDGHAGRPASSTSSGTSAQVGGGRPALVAGRRAQHADHLAQFLERQVGVGRTTPAARASSSGGGARRNSMRRRAG